MNLFPEPFVACLIYLALAWTAAGTAILLALLWKDFKDKNIW